MPRGVAHDRCINKGRYRIAFVLKAPLYLFCVSDWGEPEHVVSFSPRRLLIPSSESISNTSISKSSQWSARHNYPGLSHDGATLTPVDCSRVSACRCVADAEEPNLFSLLSWIGAGMTLATSPERSNLYG